MITGANTGLGYETARALVAKGARVVLAVRNLDKGKAAADLIGRRYPGADVAVQELDLTSLESVRAAADQLRAGHDRIDLLINNAGVMMTPKQTTKDGFELQFGTNHLGHFALTGLLLDRLLAAPGSRVVTVSSNGHRFGRIRFDDLQSERSYSRAGAYGQSKLANLLFTYELQRRLAGTDTIAIAAHPGGSSSELGRYLPGPVRCGVSALIEQSTEMGALPTLRAATDPTVRGGQYYGPGGFLQMRGLSQARLVQPPLPRRRRAEATVGGIRSADGCGVSARLTGRLGAMSLHVPPYPPPRYDGNGEVSATLRKADTPADFESWGVKYTYLATEQSTGGEFGLYRVDLGPQAGGPGPHFHKAMSESFFVLSGQVRLYDGRRLDCRRARRLPLRPAGRPARLRQRVRRAGVAADAVHSRGAAGVLFRGPATAGRAVRRRAPRVLRPQ